MVSAVPVTAAVITAAAVIAAVTPAVGPGPTSPAVACYACFACIRKLWPRLAMQAKLALQVKR